MSDKSSGTKCSDPYDSSMGQSQRYHPKRKPRQTIRDGFYYSVESSEYCFLGHANSARFSILNVLPCRRKWKQTLDTISSLMNIS